MYVCPPIRRLFELGYGAEVRRMYPAPGCESEYYVDGVNGIAERESRLWSVHTGEPFSYGG